LNNSDRGSGQAPKEPAERFAKMLDLLTNDKSWAKDYDEFVQNVSFAADEERISFSSALAAVRRLIAKVQR
jgi:hypothetical protein